jgi:hypothetical protein
MREKGQANRTLTENIMTTLTNNMAVANGFAVVNGFDWVLPGKEILKAVKNVTLFLAAPFIGLAYLLAFPFIGLAMIAWIAGKAVAKSRTARRIGMLIAAPLITVAFVTLGPVVGLGVLVWMGGTAFLKI